MLIGQKLSTFAIVAGIFLMLLGLSFLPAGLQNDQAILGAGICIFSFGALTSAAGFYLKARVLHNAPELSPKAPPKPVRGSCELCATESPVIHCRVHELHLCGNCVSKHYDFRSCVYIPSNRRNTPAKAARSAARA